MGGDFFQQRQPASEMKHGILGDYVGMFTGKAGRLSNTGRVVYIDGFAGPGAYEDESPGSPLVAAGVATLLSRRRELVGYFIEEHRADAQQLRQNLRDAGRENWEVWNARAEEALPEALQRVGDDPLLLFLDPHGLAIPFVLLVNEVMSRQATTEVLLYFTRKGLKRLAHAQLQPEWWHEAQRNRDAVAANYGEEQLAAMEGARRTILKRLDDFLGGEWWREYALSGDPDWPRQVRDGYIDLVRRQGQWETFVTPVPQRLDGPPVYELVLFTRHSHGIYAFNDATARAYRWLHEQHWREPGTLFAEAGGGEPDPRPAYVEQIKQNVAEAFRQGHDQFKVSDDLRLLLDDSTRGRAGSSEILKALQQLHDEDIVGGDRPKSDKLEYYVVTRGSNAPAT